MRAITKEWVDKAEDDIYSSELLLRAGEHPMASNSCFHSQQSVEKYLKAYLIENEVEFPRTHQLMGLVELCAGVDESFLEISQLVRRIEGYAVAVRYPGISIDVGAAEKALQTAGIIRDFCVKNWSDMLCTHISYPQTRFRVGREVIHLKMSVLVSEDSSSR